MGTGGMGVCLVGATGWVVLCNRALPGELLSCRIVAVKKGRRRDCSFPGPVQRRVDASQMPSMCAIRDGLGLRTVETVAHYCGLLL
jgi:hypothetical protein